MPGNPFQSLNLWALLELAALSGFVIAQPVFDALARAPEFLVFRKASGTDVAQLAAALIVLPPALLWCLEALAGFARESARRHVHVGLLALLFGLFALQVLGRVRALDRWMAVLVSVATATVFVCAYARWTWTRTWLRATAVAPIAFAMLFLLTSPVAALLTSNPSSFSSSPAANPAPVVLLVFDELPLVSMLDSKTEIDGRLYPNFAALARDGIFFRNATAVAARTPHSVPAMLTGRFPRSQLAPTTSQYPDNLFTLLARSHDVRAFESVTALCPPHVCHEASRRRTGSLLRDVAHLWLQTLVPDHHSRRDPLGDVLAEERSGGKREPPGADAWFLLDKAGENQPRRFQEFLSSIDGKGVPFHFLHLILPHAPWQYLPDGLQYPPRDLGLVTYDQHTGEPWPMVVNRQRHILQTMYVDTLLGHTMERLKQVGLYDRATVLVTADHGISFTPGVGNNTRLLTAGNEHEIAWVPFLLKIPWQAVGGLSDANVLGVDVAPTLANLAGVELPWPADGISVIGQVPEDRRKIWFNEPGTALTIEPSSYGRVAGGGPESFLRPEEGAAGMFLVGPFAEMVGTSLEHHRIGEEKRVVAVVEDVPAFDMVDERSGTVPSLISGYLGVLPPRRQPLGVAIAVNGTIATASQLFAHGDQPYRFAGMVAPTRFQRGSNRVEVFLIGSHEGGVFLSRVRIVPTPSSQ